jgi:hypothetical protein
LTQRGVFVVLALLLWQAPRVDAQQTLPNPFPPTPYPYPYPYPYWDQGGFGPGNVLRGAATVMDAQGNLMLQQEQARILREQANQAKLDTKRKTLDWLNYEREHKWTFTQEQERIESMRLVRLLKNPRESEVLSGSAMNTLLPYLAQLAQKGIQGSPVYLDQNLLKNINVTGKGSGNNLGVLGDGKLNWPIALRGPDQQEADKLIAKAMADAAAGNLTLGEYKQAVNSLDKLQQKVTDMWSREEIDSAMFLDSKRFLQSARGGLAVLTQPDAAKWLGGGFAARGHTVGELVTNMTNQGLSFARALPGQEPAYFGLYSSMQEFAAGGQNETGFRVTLAPPIMEAATKKQ